MVKPAVKAAWQEFVDCRITVVYNPPRSGDCWMEAAAASAGLPVASRRGVKSRRLRDCDDDCVDCFGDCVAIDGGGVMFGRLYVVAVAGQ